MKKWKFISDPRAGEAFLASKSRDYLRKMKGNTTSPPRENLFTIVWSWIGAFAGIAALNYINISFLEHTDLVMIIGSFGASAVLIYGAIESPFAQPRNLVGGHVLSAIIGVTSFQLLHEHIWLCAAIAVATSIAAMHASKTLHPPGGATALIAVIGSDKIHEIGYMYVLIPTGSGALIMLAIALLINNIPKNRKYPQFWF